ncbi:MAG: carbonate dehydratase [Longimicrobiales bacterium]|nr:carbonate dehydratase [Longimicrobiales bacterium]
MRHLPQLFANNRAWAADRLRIDPGYFQDLAREQHPSFLWIGCSDSRVPANEIVGLPPGELFVHRNVANVVVHSDLNCLAVVQFAVEVLQVPHVIVCGHYGCGGVTAAWRHEPLGLMDHWLRHVEDVARKHRAELGGIADEPGAVDRLCELNVLAQTVNVCRTDSIRDAWARGQELSVHAWIYGLTDGRLHDLGFAVTSTGEVEDAYEEAIRTSAASSSY